MDWTPEHINRESNIVLNLYHKYSHGVACMCLCEYNNCTIGMKQNLLSVINCFILYDMKIQRIFTTLRLVAVP